MFTFYVIYIKNCFSWNHLMHELNISECYRTTGCRSGLKLADTSVDLFNYFSILHFQNKNAVIVSRGQCLENDAQLPPGLTGQTG